MTHQNHQTNGASLEDCHTNFFALTDLCGIKWRKFVNGERANASSDPLDDPILRSYSRCMQADILCVWRRVPSNKPDNSDPNPLSYEISSSKVHPPLSLAAAKELWIFWYGEEPDLIELVDADLIKAAANQCLWNGTWERGLTYECRSLLFKALHNLMERFVLTKDIVRFGKWFVQPCTNGEGLFGRSSQHLSFSFTFFVHGDTVCASIDLREHPAVRPLTKQHLADASAAFAAAANPSTAASQSHELGGPSHMAAGGVVDGGAAGADVGDANNNNSTGNGSMPRSSVPRPRKVILAPFGIAAVLTGNSCKSTDPMAEKILDDWASFFPLCSRENSNVPPVVEVVSGGHKMYHPSIYVLVTDLDDMEDMELAAATATNAVSEIGDCGAIAGTKSVADASHFDIKVSHGAVPHGPSPIAALLATSITAASAVNSNSIMTTASTHTPSATNSRATSVVPTGGRLHQPYYNTPPSSFTCNTTNTHMPPTAATEMPERAWQDCITNTLHVAAYAAAASTAINANTTGSSSNPMAIAGVAAEDAADNSINQNNNNNSISSNVDSKHKVQQQLFEQQQQQQRQQIWGFVDPTQKAPCICINHQSSTISSTAAATFRACSSSSTIGTPNLKASGLSGNSNNYNNSIHTGSQQHQQQQQQQNYYLNQQQHLYRPETVLVHSSFSALDAIQTFSRNSNCRIPFHKRQQHQQQQQQRVGDFAHVVKRPTATAGSDTNPRSRATPATMNAAVVQTPHGTPQGGASTYSRNSIGDSLPVPSVGSPPGTPTASPHPNSTLSQPTSVAPPDQLSNMSPRAPTSVSNLQQPATPLDQLLDKNTPAPTPTDQHEKSITASPYVHAAPASVEAPPSADGGCGAISGPGSVPPPSSVGRCTPTLSQQQQAALLGANIIPPSGPAGATAGSLSTGTVGAGAQCGVITVKKFETLTTTGIEIKLDGTGAPISNRFNIGCPVVTPAAADAARNDFYKLYTPPQVNVKDIDSFANDDCLKLDVLYDFTVQDAWANYPMKRFKPNEVAKPRGNMRTKNLYEGHTHFKPLMPSPGSVYNSQLLSLAAARVAATAASVGACGGVSSLSELTVDGSCSGIMGGGLVGIAAAAAITSMDTSSDGVDGGNVTGVGFFQDIDVKPEVLSGTSSPCKESKPSLGSSGGGNLYTAEGLNPSLNDLEQLFETSSNEDCSSVQIHTPPDSNNPSNGCGGGGVNITTIDEQKRSTVVASAVAAVMGNAAVGTAGGIVAMAALQNCSGIVPNNITNNNNTGNNIVGNTNSSNNNNNNNNNGSGNNSGCGSNSGASSIQAEDLTKMFPTPPSHEQHHPNSSPCQMDIQMTDLSVNTSSASGTLTLAATLDTGLGVTGMIKLKQEYSIELGSPVDQPIEDWTYVYQPPSQAKFVGSSKYAPLTNLPSQELPPLLVPSSCVYEPSWTKKQSRVSAAAQAAAAQQHQQQLAQQQQQQQQQQPTAQQQQQHQHLQDLLVTAPRTPLQQPRTPLGGPVPSPLHSNTVPTPLSSGGGSGNNLLLNQLNCPQAALTNTPGAGSGTPTMQQLMQRAGMSPISPAPACVPFPRGSPAMMQQRNTPIHPPPPYEMAVASPATSTSSYLNKQLNSQEPPHTPQSVGMRHTHIGGGHNGGGGGNGCGGPHSVPGSGAGAQLTSIGHNSTTASAAATRHLPEVSSVIVNILLYDTALNVFRDHNFDSSTVCVCNADSQKVGNIRGADSGLYVPLPGGCFNPTPQATSAAAVAGHTNTSSHMSGGAHGGVGGLGHGGHGNNMRMLSVYGGGGVVGSALDSPASLPGAGSGHAGSNSSSSANTPAGGGNQHISGYVDEDPLECTCGFSAVMNRRLAYRAGLFYEDEMEITGIADDPERNKKQSLVSLVASLSAALRPVSQKANNNTSASSLVTALARNGSHALEKMTPLVEAQAHAVFDLLLEQCSIIQTSSSSVHRALQRHRRRLAKHNRQPQSIAGIANVLEFVDANDIVCLALEQARLASDNGNGSSSTGAGGSGSGGQRYDLHEFAHQHQLSPFHHSTPGAPPGGLTGGHTGGLGMLGGGTTLAHRKHVGSAASALASLLMGGPAIGAGTTTTSASGGSGGAALGALCSYGNGKGSGGSHGPNNRYGITGRLSVHKWPYIPVGYTRSNKDIVRTMNSIQPMLQNAFHSKSRSAAGSKDATYTVSGPLTWRQFHRLAGRASGQCEPQPIPSVIVGQDKDWISVAPLAIHYWDKFLLEPYSYARDVAYLIVCPDNEYVSAKTRAYFKELSSTYEMCKLGRHTAMRGWEGVLTVGARPGESASPPTPLDDWLRTLDDTAVAEKLRLYAQAFLHQLAPYLSRIPGDRTLLNPPDQHGGRDRATSGSGGGMHHNSGHTIGGGLDPCGDQKPSTHHSPKMGDNSSSGGGGLGGNDHGHGHIHGQTDNSNTDVKPDIKPDIKPGVTTSAALLNNDPLGIGGSGSGNDSMEDDINPPALVLYVVEPFTFGSDSPDMERLACIALLRCYAELLKIIPDSVRANLSIQIISLESILEMGRTRSRRRFSDELKCLALNIFAQCRRHMVHAQTVKSLTGFGTAANMEQFLKSKDEKNRQPYRMYTPPYVLAPLHEKTDRTDFSRASASMRAANANEQKYSVLYCNYCLSEDQSYLLATVTDDRGELLEKVCINIDVPNRLRRRKAPARRVGLRKLMDFIMGVVSQTAQPWRLVIGRIGRIGHGELKSWSSLLSKQNLQKASKQLRDMCKQCTLMYPPSILSACLVTLEPDAKLRVMPDQFTPDERFSQISMQNPLSTPQDVTCTHILVFPTSAVCLSFTRQFQNEPQVDLDNDFLNFEEDDNEDFATEDIMGDLLFDCIPHESNHGSPDRMEDNRSWQSAGGNNFNSAQQQDVEEVGAINQQPLAVGYMVSTAPTGQMPAWFWSACPHLEDVCPVFLKTALHLHVPNIQTTDDILNSTNVHSSANDHPLDSSLTADVLRYVLEGYNALSWLALDSNTHDRLSCLPINVQTLMDLYHLTAAIV